jgi:hypothetical protein
MPSVPEVLAHTLLLHIALQLLEINHIVTETTVQPNSNCTKDCCSKICTRFASLHLRFGLAKLNTLWICYTPIGIVLSLKKKDC